jgi:DNA polymerase-3 subunit delta'
MKYNKLAHPDLHFVFPVIKKKSGKDTVSDDFLPEWRELLESTPYFNFGLWLKEMGVENQQAQIYVKESDEILRKLSLKSSQGGYKVMIIWLPEKMNVDCSNKLLKLLEEPPAQTVFLLVSEEPDRLLTTILSRTQRFQLHGISEQSIADTLKQRFGLQETDAQSIAHRSEGNFLKALETIHLNEENRLFFELFVSLMRLSYQRKIREMKQWSETVAGLGRERQKNFLAYCQRMIRENFIYNFKDPSLVYLSNEEQNFSSRFSPFVNERNVMGIMDELSEAQRHIEQNVNARMVFFDFSLKMIVLLVQK